MLFVIYKTYTNIYTNMYVCILYSSYIWLLPIFEIFQHSELWQLSKSLLLCQGAPSACLGCHSWHLQTAGRRECVL